MATEKVVVPENPEFEFSYSADLLQAKQEFDRALKKEFERRRRDAHSAALERASAASGDALDKLRVLEDRVCRAGLPYHDTIEMADAVCVAIMHIEAVNRLVARLKQEAK